MFPFAPASISLFAIFFGCSKLGVYAEVRIDDEPIYVEYQDIYKAFQIVQPNSSEFYWLYGFNYNSPHTQGKSCVYFDIEQLSQHGMNYSSHFFRNGTKGTYPYTGNFTISDAVAINGTNIREKNNILHSDLRSDIRWPMDYKLIYSDYRNCSIFRIPSMENGHGCMVLVGDSQARNGMPKWCASMYRMACDEHQNRFQKIFNETCEKALKN